VAAPPSDVTFVILLIFAIVSGIHYMVLVQRKTEYNDKLVKFCVENCGPAQGGSLEVRRDWPPPVLRLLPVLYLAPFLFFGQTLEIHKDALNRYGKGKDLKCTCSSFFDDQNFAVKLTDVFSYFSSVL